MKATCIWQPKYSTQMVLVATRDVRAEKCYVFFCCDKNYKDLYSYDGMKVRQECGISSNGKIPCFNIPLSWLVNEGELPKELEQIREIQYAKFKYTTKTKKGD